MDKGEAIDRAKSRCGGAAQLNLHNTHFANINASKEVWWLDIPLPEVSVGGPEEINLLLYDNRSDDLHYLRIATDYLRANITSLVVRDDKGCISLELAADKPRLFQDVRPASGGVQFAQFKT